MARYLEYKLHAPMNGHGMSTPTFITNGGHWCNDNKMISVEPDTTEYYIPESVKVLTLDQLKARQVAIHAVTPFMKMDQENPDQEPGDVMTDAEVETMVANWASAQ